VIFSVNFKTLSNLISSAFVVVLILWHRNVSFVSAVTEFRIPQEQETFDRRLKRHAALQSGNCLATALFFYFLSRQKFYAVIC